MTTKLNLNHLKQLTELCSTPGDEGLVGSYLLHHWKERGWNTGTLGRYVVYAESPDWDDARPTILLTAHMDSPGFIVQSTQKDKTVAIALGGAHFEEKMVEVVGKHGGRGMLSYLEGEKARDFQLTTLEGEFPQGERLCYVPVFRETEGEMLEATFLDNRIGCWGLCQVADRLGKDVSQSVNVLLAATCCEEMTGFGADVLATHFGGDVVVCLDATYADQVQNVCFGQGPVLTVTDKSTLLSPAVVEAVESLFGAWGIPLQKEYYNFSGTDARAFPAQGFGGAVVSLLVATEGNHGPAERASLKDLQYYEAMLMAFCQDGEGVSRLKETWGAWA